MRVHVNFKNTKYSPFIKGYIKSKSRILKDLCLPPARLNVDLDQEPDDTFRARLEYRDPRGRLVAKSSGHDLVTAAFEDALADLSHELACREPFPNYGPWRKSQIFV